MMERKKIILYELNEVPYKIFDHFAEMWPQSALAALRRNARAYETYAEDAGHLSPWITWPTLHRGVVNTQHEISDLGQDLTHVDREFPAIWEILARSGAKVGVFGSLHSYPLPKDLSNYAYFVPDTFAAGPECFPRRLQAFQRFNLAMVSKSGRNVDSGIALKEAGAFLRAAPGLGLRGRTILDVAKQMSSEVLDRSRTVRRRTTQVQIAFDFFMKALRTERPDVTTFFTNHVASSLHRYWPALFPADYTVSQFGDDWLSKWDGEIPFVVGEANRQIAELIQFVNANQEYSLIVSSSMGQAAVDGKSLRKTELTIKNPLVFAEAMGVARDRVRLFPAMAPQFVFGLSDADRMIFMDNISKIRVNGQPVKASELGEGRVRVDFGFPNLEVEEIMIIFGNEHVTMQSVGIHNLKLMDAAGANAYHIPEGIMLVYEANSHQYEGSTRKISTTEVAPSILRNFGVRPPSYMQKGLSI